MAKNPVVSRKSLSEIILYAAENVTTVWEAADALEFDTEGTRKAIADFDTAMHRPRKSKPSAESIKNTAIMHELADEINVRGAEFTAADIAECYTDPDGMQLTARKVGALLRQAVAMGLVAVSPEPWSVKHYAPVGFEFAKKPVRIKKNKDADNADDSSDDK